MTFYIDSEIEPYEDDLLAHEENEVFLDREFDVEELDFDNLSLDLDDIDINNDNWDDPAWG